MLNLLFHEAFMRYAFFAVLLISPMFALIGTMIVQNKMAFFSDALGHGAFTGIAVGAVLGLIQTSLSSPILSALVFSAVFAFVVTLVKHKTSMALDTVIGVFSSVGVALGLFIVTIAKLSYNSIGSFLVGDILSITPSNLILMTVIFVVFIALWLLIPNKLLLGGINETLALSRSIRAFLVESVFACTVAVIVTITLPWIGILVINSYLVLPAASARNISNNMRQYTLFSVLISLLCGILGLILAYILGTAAGATIILVNAVVFFITFALKSIRG